VASQRQGSKESVSCPNIVRMSKSRKLIWSWNATATEDVRNVYKFDWENLKEGND
jgi:hypothetical protein